MGNSSSAAHHPHPHHGLQGQPQRWTHSYPRATSTAASAAASGGLKVLPERVPGQRLRVTNNGAILQNGGTISGRRPSVGNLPRQRSSSQGSHHESKRSLYGSEPDLRYTGREFHHQPYSNDSPAKLRISRSRKKYKAPPAPHINGNAIDSSSPDSYQHWEMSGGGSGGGETAAPSRRLRLSRRVRRQRGGETRRQSLSTQLWTGHAFPRPTPEGVIFSAIPG
ncbi:uncharacterized protein LOC120356655 [Nilaparvata lugens]|uniref:uncharacterized protein LOC120356655 n=1 Tax=Nilaparvata lugens TaxID=108931 RepID=UPI00193CDAE7|nr:uncharacterized protein LOC120356655 [Nilaparvata lugens]